MAMKKFNIYVGFTQRNGKEVRRKLATVKAENQEQAYEVFKEEYSSYEVTGTLKIVEQNSQKTKKQPTTRLELIKKYIADFKEELTANYPELKFTVKIKKHDTAEIKEHYFYGGELFEKQLLITVVFKNYLDYGCEAIDNELQALFNRIYETASTQFQFNTVFDNGKKINAEIESLVKAYCDAEGLGFSQYFELGRKVNSKQAYTELPESYYQEKTLQAQKAKSQETTVSTISNDDVVDTTEQTANTDNVTTMKRQEKQLAVSQQLKKELKAIFPELNVGVQKKKAYGGSTDIFVDIKNLWHVDYRYSAITDVCHNYQTLSGVNELNICFDYDDDISSDMHSMKASHMSILYCKYGDNDLRAIKEGEMMMSKLYRKECYIDLAEYHGYDNIQNYWTDPIQAIAKKHKITL